MRDMNAEYVTQVVLDSYAGVTDERLKEILGELIPRLHDLIRAVKLTPTEWKTAMDFLQVAGKVTSDQRNEFILLSDLLGVSAVVDLVDGDTDEGATMGTLLGPFYVPGQPDLPSGSDLIRDNPGEPVVVQGQVRSANGKPIPGARLEIWQNSPIGLYTMQDPNQPDDNLRCTLHADETGSYSFSTVKPVSYCVRDDAAGGRLTRAAGRDTWRPAHIHFMVSADGHKRLITQGSCLAEGIFS